MDRRHFLTSATAFGLSSLLQAKDPIGEFEPFIQRGKLPDSVILESLTLFERDRNWFIRARSKDGVDGWSVGHPSKTALSYPVLQKVLAPFFANRDMRDLDSLIDQVYLSGSNYKMQGQLFWVAMAAAEAAIIDLLGRVANESAATLLGGVKRKKFDLYIANNHRNLSPEASLKKIIASVDSISARAVKFKIGGRMKVADQIPGRTEKLIPLVAEALGDKCTIYADANSSYLSVDKAIEVGRILEANKIAFYEEPCPFDYLDETRRVADALEIPIAWGEQESSQWRFQHMINTGGVQVPQPDLIYYGGLIRSLRVARMAAAKGLNCTPHISGGGWGFLYTSIYTATCPNPGPHQEYKGINHKFPWTSTGKPIAVNNGTMNIPTGPGLGAEIDPDYLAKARRV